MVCVQHEIYFVRYDLDIFEVLGNIYKTRSFIFWYIMWRDRIRDKYNEATVII